MDSGQQNQFYHRSSLPGAFHHGTTGSEASAQGRSFSATPASFQDDASGLRSSLAYGWDDGVDQPSAGLSHPWQRQSFASPGQQSQQTENIKQILGQVPHIVQNHSSSDAPWIPHVFQQNVPQRFDGDSFRSSFGAATVVPDTRSFAQDSAYYSQESLKRPAPLEEPSPDDKNYLLSPSNAAPHHFIKASPRSVVSDSQLHKRTRRSGPLTKLECSECGKNDLRNQSDLKKHFNQHSKPHTCEITTCEKHIVGFGTSNDLERHRASVHKLRQRCGTTEGFICYACEQVRSTSPRKENWWPRKDNFKSHIKRKHRDWYAKNLEGLIQLSSRPTRPADTRTVGASCASQHGNGDDQLDKNISPIQSQSPQYPDLQFSTLHDEGAMLAGGGQWTNNQPDFVGGAAPPLNLVNTFQASLAQETPIMPGFPVDLAPNYSQSGAVDHIGMPTSVPTRNTNCLSIDTPIPAAPPISPHGPPHQPLAQPAGAFKCPFCGKIKKRNCDLRKHEKRHTRPYGCTFPRCARRFGSRNDWKRHEEKQHGAPREQWRCALPPADRHPSAARCGALFDSPPPLAEHLAARHDLRPDNPLHWSALEACHIGGEAFWCGFCDAIVPGGVARLQHIGDHFDKDGATIEDWVDVERNVPKRLLGPPPPGPWRAGRRPSSSSSGEGEDGDEDVALGRAGSSARLVRGRRLVG